jgi:DNA-binding transcriptional MerR regulator
MQGEFFDVQSVKPGDELPEPVMQSERSRRGLKDFTIPKLYHSISEVSAMTAMEQYVLRYWETEFEELRPHKNRAGNRIYSEKDIKLIFRIKELLRNERYTIEGAKQVLKEEREEEKETRTMPVSRKAEVDESQLAIIPPPQPKEVAVRRDDLAELRKLLVNLRDLLAKNIT